MSKKILECQYCKSIITEKDTTCPKCGANCSDVIKEYRKEVEKEEEERKKAISDSINQSFNNFAKIPLFIVGGFALLIIIIITSTILLRHNPGSKKKEPVTGKVNEVIKNDTYNLKLDSYEAFEYHDDFFKDCNTKEGYQKVAFHFVIENTTNETISTGKIINSIQLKADDELLDHAEVKTDTNFCKVVQGKENYNRLPSTNVIAKDSISGYVGFQVPKNKPKLKFIVENTLIIEMDNPFYEKNK